MFTDCRAKCIVQHREMILDSLRLNLTHKSTRALCALGASETCETDACANSPIKMAPRTDVSPSLGPSPQGVKRSNHARSCRCLSYAGWQRESIKSVCRPHATGEQEQIWGKASRGEDSEEVGTSLRLVHFGLRRRDHVPRALRSCELPESGQGQHWIQQRPPAERS